jgi:hypothetical protein
MNETQSHTAVLLAALVCVGLTSCRRERPKPLPERPPTVERLRFTGPDSGWPPRPLGRTNVREVRSTQQGLYLTDTLAAQLRRVAIQDARVQSILGQRFAFISVEAVDVPKGSARAPSARLFRLLFFSHSNNVPVEVLVRDLRVQQVERRPNYDVPEGREEVDTAIALAREDPRLRPAVAALEGSAILAYLESGAQGFGHRVLHVTFARAGEDVPRYWAYVDLTDRRVLSVGEER